MDINDYIKELSSKDKKTLSQKALKLAEEVGELAKVVLPYDSAHGTNHRFINREALLEEVVDVYLTNISIAHSLEFTDEEFNDMLKKKTEKWGSIQAKEEKIEFPLPYEIHITVNTEFVWDKWRRDKYPFEVEDFRSCCKEIGVKPIVLDLENGGKSVMKDVMTSSHIYGDNKTSYEECERITKELVKYGYVVTRKKVETVPWHPAAPSNDGDKMPENCYFEAHIGCIITPDQKPQLEHNVKRFDAHLSRNFFKKLDNGKFVNMVTLRSYDGVYGEFEIKVEKLRSRLKEESIDYEKVITEFSVYDTNISHDNKWLVKELSLDELEN